MRDFYLRWAMLSLYLSTAAVFLFAYDFNLGYSAKVPSIHLYLIPASVAEILMLDVIGVLLLFKLGPVRSFLAVVLAGALQLTTWGMTWTFAMPGGLALTWSNVHNLRVLGITLAYPIISVALLLYFSRRVWWRVSPAYLLFLGYYLVYFLLWGGASAVSSATGNNVEDWQELGYQFVLNAAFLLGFYWRNWRLVA